jgi:lysophospholipase L1-like esterase
MRNFPFSIGRIKISIHLMRSLLATALFIALASLPALAITKIACVGNSITYGYGIDSWTQSYPTRLQQALGTTDYTVSNFGFSGQTMLKNTPESYWIRNTFTNARDFLPNIVVVELGTNDSKPDYWYKQQDAFTTDYEAFIDTFTVLSSKPTLWITLAPYANNADWKILDTSITLRINPAILQVGLDKGVNIIDLHTLFNNRTWLLEDSVHPNVVGAEALAGIIQGYLQRTPQRIAQNGNILTAPAGHAFQWYLDGAPIAGATSSTLAIAQTGTYKVSVKADADNDSRLISEELAITSIPATGIIASNAATSLAIRGHQLQVSVAQPQTVIVQRYDLQGNLRQTYTWTAVRGTNAFPLPTAPGVQLLRIQSGAAAQVLLYTAH